MPIYCGTSPVSALYHGSTAIGRVYHGSTLVYDSAAAAGGAMPTFVGSVFNAGSGSLSPLYQDTGRVSGDLMLAICETPNQAIIPPSGWTQYSGSPIDGSGTRLTLYYKFSNGAETSFNTTWADVGDHQVIVTGVFRGVNVTTPFKEAASGTWSGANPSCPAITTTLPNQMILNMLVEAGDFAAFGITAVSNANLANLTLRRNGGTGAGNGGGAALITGELATAGGSGNTAVTSGSPYSPGVMLTLALNGA